LKSAGAPPRPPAPTAESKRPVDKSLGPPPRPGKEPGITVTRVTLPDPRAAGAPAPARSARSRVIFAGILIAGIGLLITGYSLNQTGLRFFGLIAIITGLVCLIKDWRPLPGRK
jgi:hypothetical protein